MTGSAISNGDTDEDGDEPRLPGSMVADHIRMALTLGIEGADRNCIQPYFPLKRTSFLHVQFGADHVSLLVSCDVVCVCVCVCVCACACACVSLGLHLRIDS